MPLKLSLTAPVSPAGFSGEQRTAPPLPTGWEFDYDTVDEDGYPGYVCNVVPGERVEMTCPLPAGMDRHSKEYYEYRRKKPKKQLFRRKSPNRRKRRPPNVL